MADERKQIQRSKRIFIDKIDSYSSKYIAEYLSTCAAGDSFEEPRAGQRFQVVGTVSAPGARRRRRVALEEYSVKNCHYELTANEQNGFSESPVLVLTLNNVIDKPETFQKSMEPIKALKRDELLQHLMNCDVIVYNISEDADAIDEATWAVSALHSEIEHFTFPKMFILVSTLMTWAKIKPADPDNPEIPVMEEEYKQKLPHPNFREHASAEKLVLKLGKTEKSKLRTYVIGAGMQYGMGEGIFHFFFKACWLGELSSIPIPETSTNVIPTIHVCDLACVVQNVIDHKPKMHYVIAVDDSHNTLEEIVTAIADVLGPGEVHKVPNDSVHLTKELTRYDLARLSLNLLIETVLLKMRLNVRWECESGLVNNIDRVVEEFRQTRSLLPLKICLLGPPAVGKSSVAAQLCKHYKLHYIGIKEAVEEKIKLLEEKLLQNEENNDMETLQETQKQLVTLKDVLSQDQGQAEDQLILQIIREKLHSKPCRNQGFVLDGYPRTFDQANKLFNDEDTEPGNFESRLLPHNEKIIPEYVFSLDATDEFLKERARNLPQSVAEEMHYTQDEFLQQLSTFRVVNTVEETVLDYFDELEIHPEHIEIKSANDPENEAVITEILEAIGEPKNYGPTPEEQKEQERKQAAEKQQRLMEDLAERILRDAKEETRMTALLEEWNRNRIEVKKQEHELLEARSLPLRHYLMKYVMPHLREGLVACSQVKPDDPIDFLAEYLLRNNTED